MCGNLLFKFRVSRGLKIEKKLKLVRKKENCHKKLFETGSVKDKNRSRQSSTTNHEENVNTVLAMFEISPDWSRWSTSLASTKS